MNTIAMKIKPILDKCDAKEKHGLLCQQVDYFQTQHEWLTKLQIKNRLSKLRKKELLKDKEQMDDNMISDMHNRVSIHQSYVISTGNPSVSTSHNTNTTNGTTVTLSNEASDAAIIC